MSKTTFAFLAPRQNPIVGANRFN